MNAGDAGQARDVGVAPGGEKRRGIVELHQADGIAGFAPGDEGGLGPAQRAHSRSIVSSNSAFRASALGHAGQRFNGPRGAAVIADKVMDGDRADILAADQPQPAAFLCLTEASRPDLHSSSSYRSWVPRRAAGGRYSHDAGCRPARSSHRPVQRPAATRKTR